MSNCGPFDDFREDLQKSTPLSVGDWVEAVTISYHYIIGYIEVIKQHGDSRGLGRIRVTQSCCDKVRVREWIDLEYLSKLPDTDIRHFEGHLLNAIDVALDTEDREEFFRRTEELRKLYSMRKHGVPRFIFISSTT